MTRWHHPEPHDQGVAPHLTALAEDGTGHPPLAQPTLAEAWARLAVLDPAAYARTRNALDGAVSGLSPYITHGFLSLSQVLAGVNQRHPIEVQHKFVYELGWREFGRHVWAQRGQGILGSLHPGPLPDEAYAPQLPPDIRLGCTGVPVVDRAVQALYATGYLHNHARMWLASYVVHVRKVHWRAGADWLYAHLLDGDLASNHLSWQWVAGTGSTKPYVFNAENVARFAPAHWHSEGSVIDTDYEALDRMARSPGHPPGAEPPPAAFQPALTEPALHTRPPAWLGARSPQAADVAGREVWLVHPWQLGALPSDLPADTVVIGLWLADFHQAWPWSEARWRFVGTRLAELAGLHWWGDAEAMGRALAGARRVRGVADPHLQPWLSQWAQCLPAPRLFPVIERPCTSFSQWWTRATKGLNSAAELLGLHRA